MVMAIKDDKQLIFGDFHVKRHLAYDISSFPYEYSLSLTKDYYDLLLDQYESDFSKDQSFDNYLKNEIPNNYSSYYVYLESKMIGYSNAWLELE